MAPNAQLMHDIVENVKAPRKLGQRVWEELRHFVRVFISASERFYWDNGFSKAAALAYTTLLSLVPVTVVGFGLIASFAASSQYVPETRRFIFQQFLPSTAAVDTVLEHLSRMANVMSDPNVNALAIAVFVITALLLINSIEYALNEIWQVYEPRTIAQRVQIFCAILVLAPILAVSAFYTAKFRLQPLIEGLEELPWLITMYNQGLPFLIDFLAFFVLYYMVPKAPVRFTSAAAAAVIVAVLFDFAKSYFAIYVVKFASYEAIYGTLAAIPIFLFWLYVTWTVVLFGAEMSYQFQYLPRTGKIWRRSVSSVGDGVMLLAVQSLVLIARAFERGVRLPSELDLAEQLGCSSVVLRPALDALKRAGVLAQSDSREMSLALQRSPEMISIETLERALFQGKQGLHHVPEMASFYQRLAAGQDRSTLTLADVLRGEQR